ncbi:MAG: HPr(Ser) kinase/phosphatase [bacterium]|nr:HPr(Ser) kinase/phosphatase [bacterium]
MTVQDMMDALGAQMNLRVVSGEKGMGREITAAEVNRPGLALAGWYDYFAKHRLQVLGKVEIYYLRRLSSAERRERIRILMEMRIPAFIVTRNYLPPEELVELGAKYNIPIIRSPGITMRVINKISSWLEEQFAPTTHVHGTLVEVHGVGVLIMGKAGVGKSECALSLVERGHILVADDVITLRVTEGNLITGFANPRIGHHMEIRGVGIINIQSLYGVKSVRMYKHVDFVVTLEPWQEGKNYERLGIDSTHIELLGVKLPNLVIPVKPGRDVALLIEAAAQNEKLKALGFNVARHFNEQLLASMKYSTQRTK